MGGGACEYCFLLLLYSSGDLFNFPVNHFPFGFAFILRLVERFLVSAQVLSSENWIDQTQSVQGAYMAWAHSAFHTEVTTLTTAVEWLVDVANRFQWHVRRVLICEIQVLYLACVSDC